MAVTSLSTAAVGSEADAFPATSPACRAMSVTVKLVGSQGSVSLALERIPERVDNLRTRGS
jgi:hypothetical protein